MATWPTDSVRTKDWGSETLTDADLEAQYDVIHTWINAAMDASTGHKHDGTTNEGPQIALAGGTQGVTGTLGIGNGGTGQTTLTGIGDIFWPVGSIYYNATVSTNPGTLMGFGTWEAYAEGKVVIGLDSGDTDFDATSDTGGNKTQTATGTTGVHNNEGTITPATGGGTSVPTVLHTHDFTSDAINLMNPYVVAYAWKRTA